MSRKRGKLSKAEEQFIRQNVHDLTMLEIAESINRTEATVERFLQKKNVKKLGVLEEEQYQRNLLLRSLKERSYYPKLGDMLTPSELEQFEEDWVEVMLQFDSNIMYTEEVQLKQWILLQILADRSMKSRKSAMQESENLQVQVDMLTQMDEEERDDNLLNSLNQQLGFAREGMIAFTREHGTILDKIKDIERSLKATREARVKKIEDSRTSWQGYLRALEDEQKRGNVGEDAEYKKLAKDKAIERLGAWHKYEDGAVDQPLLTPENAISQFDKPEDEDG